MKDILRCGLLLVAVACTQLTTPSEAQGQTCPNPTGNYNLQIGDGSTPKPPGCPTCNDAMTIPVGICGTQITWGNTGGTVGTAGELELPIGECWDAEAAFPQSGTQYHPAAGQDGAWTCHVDAGCTACDGTYTAQVYSSEGAISGTVVYPGSMKVPDPVPAIRAHPDACTFSAPTATAEITPGETSIAFTFADPEMLPNAWGLPTVAQEPSTEGKRNYVVSIGTCALASAPIEVRSNKDALVQLTVLPPYAPDPDRRGPVQTDILDYYTGPSPTTLQTLPCNNGGRPVNFQSGNMWLDQTDIVIPGRGPRLFLQRSYNSRGAVADETGIFGRGWTHNFERQLSEPESGVIKLMAPGGIPVFFADTDQDLTYEASLPITGRDWFVKTGSTYTHHFLDGAQEVYDGAGRLTSVSDPSGNALTLSYDASGNLVQVDAASGKSLLLEYEAAKLARLQGPLGLIAEYTYGPAGDLAMVAYPDGSGYAFAYDPSGQLTQLSDASGRIVERHEYLDGRAITSEIDGGRERLEFTYGPWSTTVTDALGNVTVHEYEMVFGQRLITKTTGACAGCGSGGEVQEWTYDPEGRLLTYTDADEATTTYTYDMAGNLETIEDALSRVTQYTYDSAGRVLTVSGPGGTYSAPTHGPAGPLTITEKLDSTTNRTVSFGYNGTGECRGSH